MAAQDDYELLDEILTRAQFNDDEKDAFIEEVMGKLGHKLKRLFIDGDAQKASGPRRIGQATGTSGRRPAGSQYAD